VQKLPSLQHRFYKRQMPFLLVKTNSIKASKETVCVTVYVLVMVLFGTDYDLGDARASAPVAEHQWVQHA